MHSANHQRARPDRLRQSSRTHWFIIPPLLALAATLAVTSLLGDSITYDETSHLTAGMSYLKTADFRLAPDHPPLAKLWAAWPLLFLDHTWPPFETPGWRKADPFLTGRTWLFDLNDGERLLPVARCMIVLLLLALCAAIYALARTLFGPGPALLSLILSVLSPTLLAHGRLVTTDLPITLCTTLTLLAFALLLRRVTPLRLLATVAALGAASVTKLSWPLVLPALALMAAVAIFRRQPIQLPLPSARRKANRTPQSALLTRPHQRISVVITIALLLALTTWISIWTTYRWRASIFPSAHPAEPEGSPTDPTLEQTPTLMAAHWHHALHDRNGQPRPGLLPAFLNWAAQRHFLPDAYLFGLAWTLEATSGRNAYFCGETSQTGWWTYFPFAFAIKTPITTLALLLAGLAALATRRPRCNDPVLLTGLIAFALVHFAYAINASFNIGHRHLLPIYPAVFVLAGPAVRWLPTRLGRWLIPIAVAWLGATNFWIHPHYLSYFNEFVGGPAQGHLYLADSNIDWGQDLKRLAHYAEQHPHQTIKLSYFGSAVPTRYGFDCKLLPSSIDTGSPEHLDGGGLYVISVTHLLGVYDRVAQESFWQQPPAQRQREIAANGCSHARIRWGRFLANLHHRSPDDRIGYSLFVYHLTPADVENLARQ